MFDLGWSELVVVAVIALIAIGPKELPGVLRTLGHWMGKVRRMAAEFQDQFKEAMREAEVDDLKKQVDDLNIAASDITSYNPIDDLNKEFETALDDKPSGDKPEATADTAAAGEETVIADERPDPVESANLAATEPPPTAPDEGGKDLAPKAAEPDKTAGAGGRSA